tara:strand:- start:210 stop:497 length:288 start_codon:yes stop_codon:yes gene_type:complete
MFHDDLYQKFLIQDLIESEAMQGRFYTADDFGKQFAEIDLKYYEWPKGIKWTHQSYMKSKIRAQILDLADIGLVQRCQMQIDGKERTIITPRVRG